MSYLKKKPEFQNDRPSKKKIAYRRFRRMLRPFILLILIIGLFIGGGWALFKMASDTHFTYIQDKVAQIIPMKITRIVIKGCDLTSEDEAKEALGVHIGDSIFSFSVQKAQERLDALTFVDHSLIKRQLPNTITIHITERKPFAVWQHQGKFMLIDRQGNIVNDTGMNGKDGQAFLKLPLVVGTGANKAAGELIDILSSYPEVKKRIVAAVFVGQRRWNLDLKDGTVALLPENQELPAIQRLTRLQKDLQLLDRPVQEIDLRLSDRLIIREDKSLINPQPNNDDDQDTDNNNSDHSSSNSP